MHGTRGTRPPVRRYLCSNRRYGGGCVQPITKAEPLENQLVEWLRGFQPDGELRNLLLDTITKQVRDQDGEDSRRSELLEQLRRLQDSGRIVAVKPCATFARYFQTVSETPKRRSGFSGVMSGSDGGRTRVRHHVEIRAKRGLHATDGRTTLLDAE